MRITDIHISNYKAFYGDHHIELDKDGKNLMLYGENGSGKSSVYTALLNFFLASVQKVTVDENIFVPKSKKETASIKLTICESSDSSKKTSYELTKVNGEIIAGDKIDIADANKIKGFFDYRKLLKTHMGHDDHVNLFEILVNDILSHAVNRFTKKEIGAEWRAIRHETDELRQGDHVVARIKSYIGHFNDGLKELLGSIEADTNTFMNYFNSNVKVSFAFKGVEYKGRRKLDNARINLVVKLFDTSLKKHHDFLNEARLSALAISVYLASIRVNPSKGKLKILVLDDLLIGLDMSNRMPLLTIIKQHFESDFQVIMTTYDKVWYELVQNYFGTKKWKYIEVYAHKLRDNDFEIPIIKPRSGLLKTAKHYLDEKDYKASAVYVRTAFERLVKLICEKNNLEVVYRKNQKELKSDDFWKSIKEQTNIDEEVVKEIEIYRGVVMNPFSHDDLEKPEFKKELEETITAIEKLIQAEKDFKKSKSYLGLESTIEKLKADIATKEATIQQMRTQINPGTA
ncbi:AAA family ATPase [Pleomorphovibrio marinus]|uniref:AAA family ATPase n=1 Tax=Pleomorphovibrio marinus TaxID=2164132 RepID=UPI000E0C3266|nr:AAA family ATPase [Pleomorphovibrio marinus]